MQLPWIDEDELVGRCRHLFHYTGHDAFSSILSTGGLAATHFQYTNDRSECTTVMQPIVQQIQNYALPIIQERIDRGDWNIFDPQIDVNTIFQQDAETIFNIALSKLPSAPRIICFSAHTRPHQLENGILTMWRLYGGSGNGIALGFNAKRFVEVTEEVIRESAVDILCLFSMVYGHDNPETERRIAESPDLTEMLAGIILATVSPGQIPHEATLSAMLKCLMLCSSTKHADFEDEREVRLLVCPSIESTSENRDKLPEVGGRPIVGCLSALDEVLIGPSESQDELSAKVKANLDAAGLDGVIIRQSKTPFRRTI